MTRSRMPLRLGLLSLGLLSLAPPAAGQAPQRPAPGPEHERLGYFVGRWKGEADLEANAFMPAGKYTSSDTCEWFEGRFAVVCRNEGKGPMGKMRGIFLISYSPEEKTYTYYGVDSSGMTMTTVARGTVEDGTWVYTDESRMGGKTVRSRYTIRELSPTSYAFTWEMMGDDGSWTTLMEGKQTKAR